MPGWVLSWAPAQAQRQALMQAPEQGLDWAPAQAQRQAKVQVLSRGCWQARSAVQLRQRWALARALHPGWRAPERGCSQSKGQPLLDLELGRGCL